MVQAKPCAILLGKFREPIYTVNNILILSTSKKEEFA